ncbi:hypothetical protein STAWA0001_1835 [Staphylococcus warneri L37603]|nr:hypothetical protein STAWA0001_1835 [Staphylococcus warneri L37603]
MVFEMIMILKRIGVFNIITFSTCSRSLFLINSFIAMLSGVYLDKIM